MGIPAEETGLLEIAKRSRGTPRVANRILRRVRDFAQVMAEGRITLSVAREALKMLEVDELGLDKMDRKILMTIIDKFSGGPVGLEALAVAICEEKDTLEDVYEPFLIQCGFLNRTPRGRTATPSAYRHFGKKAPGESQGLLFEGP
jgi:Holliday junction DNA helicase RuvB